VTTTPLFLLTEKNENSATERTLTRKRKRTSSSFSSTEDEEIGLILTSTDEEDTENGSHCLYYRHFFSEDKRVEKRVHCTK
jgi:hypothetical protein